MQPRELQGGMELTFPILQGFFHVALANEAFISVCLGSICRNFPAPTELRRVSPRGSADAECFAVNDEGPEGLFS